MFSRTVNTGRDKDIISISRDLRLPNHLYLKSFWHGRYLTPSALQFRSTETEQAAAVSMRTMDLWGNTYPISLFTYVFLHGDSKGIAGLERYPVGRHKDLPNLGDFDSPLENCNVCHWLVSRSIGFSTFYPQPPPRICKVSNTLLVPLQFIHPVC